MRRLLTLLFIVNIGSLATAQTASEARAETIPLLRANPSREDVGAYLTSLRQFLFEKSPQALMDDKITSVFADIPNQYIDLILKEASAIAKSQLPVWGVMTMPYIKAIQQRELGESDKSVIIDYLDDFPDLIEVISRKNWIPDSEAAIIKSAIFCTDRSAPGYVNALVKINSPEAGELLSQLLLKYSARQMAKSYYNLYPSSDENVTRRLKSGEVPYINISEIVDRAWKIATLRMDSDIHAYAPIAASYGHRDALVVMLKKLSSEPNLGDKTDNTDRKCIWESLRRLVPSEGKSMEEVITFVFEKREKLVFDQESGTYGLP